MKNSANLLSLVVSVLLFVNCTINSYGAYQQIKLHDDISILMNELFID